MIKKIIPVVLPCFFLSCANYGQLNFITKLPKKLDENSGIAFYKDSTAWFVEDNGNADDLHQVDFKGNLLKKFEVKNAKNHDWEDLTTDGQDNLYIGDFGNNNNNRKNLVVYKLPDPENEPGDKIDAETIAFQYPEQKDFPPKKRNRLYDAEAFFHYKGNLYIITKNRSNPFTGRALAYKIPDTKGSYQAEYLGEITTCSEWNTCRITSAAISPDGKTVVLLGYGKLWVITDFTTDNFVNGNRIEIDLGIRTQLESVCFMDDSTLLLSDEKKGNEGRNLYSFKLY